MTQRGWAELRAYRIRQENKWLKIKLAIGAVVLFLTYMLTHY